MSGWKPGVIMAAMPDGRRDPLPGWISEPFGIDWGIHMESGKACWIVHHLPTGYNMFACDENIDRVMQIIDLLRSLGDWSFDSPEIGTLDYGDTLKIVEAHGFSILSPTLIGRPDYPVWHEAFA